MKKSTYTQALALLFATFISAVFSIGTVSLTEAGVWGSVKNGVKKGANWVDDNLIPDTGGTLTLRDCHPKKHQVAFFEHRYYKGKCVIRGLGTFKTPHSMGIKDNSVSSVRVGPSTKVYVSRGRNNTGYSRFLFSNVQDMGKTTIGHDTISSVVIIKRRER